MKKIIFSLAIMAFAYGATAQDTKFSIAANLGIPTEKGYKMGYGADVQLDYGLSEIVAITGSIGYLNYHWKMEGLEGSSESGNNGFVPILAGAKFGFGESNLYGHAQLGYSVSTAKGGGGAFAYAPSIGYQLSENLDASVKYLAFSKDKHTTGYVGLRLAYNF